MLLFKIMRALYIRLLKQDLLNMLIFPSPFLRLRVKAPGKTTAWFKICLMLYRNSVLFDRRTQVTPFVLRFLDCEMNMQAYLQ